ncbi:MAG: riboflavin synthase [Magnetococcales bacterium]|nr:riboflavin synthase [Magnetococcales bacterium]
MFTGLVEEVGSVQSLTREGREGRLTVRCGFSLESVKLGDSIAINGACLTVVRKSESAFTVQASEETLGRTTLGNLRPGAPVNLERALQVGARLDGHIVQGHVDAVAQVENLAPRGRGVEIWFRVPRDAGRYIVPKGSVALDGVSLTVNQARDEGESTHFSVLLIPHTQQRTTLAGLAPGGEVNLETDILGRYVERLLRRAPCAVAPDEGRTPEESGERDAASRRSGGIDELFLLEKGFM